MSKHPVWRRRALWGGLVVALVVVAACSVLIFSLFAENGDSDAEDTQVAVDIPTQVPTLTLPPISEPEETDNPRLIPGLDLELPRLTDEDEVEIGREAAAEFERDNPLSTDQNLLDRATRIGNNIVPHQPRPGIPYTFKVVDSPEINALAFPGGFIYIYRGMIEFVQSDDELAGVIGHEIAHVALRHSARQIEAIAAGQMAIQAVLSENPDLENVYQDQSFQIASEVVTDVVLKGWGRVNELDADEHGTVYMAQAGYDPQAVLDLLNRFVSQGGEVSGDVMETLLSTHPPFQERIARVEEAIVVHGLG
jgi:predicted Zn-dependent protease